MICLANADGSYEEQTLATTRAALTAFFKGRGVCRILIESSTESEWVACLLEGLGHEAIVAAPGYELMYATRSKRIKTDRRDGRALCDACRLGHYKPAHRTVEPWRSVRQELSVRDALVRSRTRMINVTRALCRQEGCSISSGHAEHFAQRVGQIQLPAALKETTSPLLRCIRLLSGRIRRCDQRLKTLAARHERVRRLLTVPCIGEVTALAFAAVVEPASRFGRSLDRRLRKDAHPAETRQPLAAAKECGRGRENPIRPQAVLPAPPAPTPSLSSSPHSLLKGKEEKKWRGEEFIT